MTNCKLEVRGWLFKFQMQTCHLPLALVAGLIGLAIVNGCAVGPDFKSPQAKTPAAWSDATNSASAETRLTTNWTGLAQWWTNFQDPKLVELVNEALRTNLDIQSAQAHLRQAFASRGIAEGGLWPSLTASGAAAYGQSATFSEKSYRAGLNGVWDLDVFGGTRRSVEAATASLLAAQEDMRNVRVTVASAVALAYIDLRSAQSQIQTAKENLDTEQRTAEVTRQKLRAGFVSALDVANAEAQAASTAAGIPTLETIAQQDIYSLSVLLGRLPTDLVDDLSKPGATLMMPPEVPAGLPSELLRRRPDIRMAEANLHSAAAQIGVAEAAFFPQFSLTGSVNFQNQNDVLGRLFNTGNRVWSIGPQINWPIFQGGSVASNVRMQKALRDASYIAYQQTVLNACKDVENQLVALAKEWDHRKLLADETKNYRQALKLSQQLYQQGTLEFVNVLDAERSVYQAETALGISRTDILVDLVNLYRALGGGWEDAK